MCAACSKLRPLKSNRAAGYGSPATKTTTASTNVLLQTRLHYIVTENTKHFSQPYKTTKIVNARQLLKLLTARPA